MSWRTIVITGRCKLDYKMGYMVQRAQKTKRIFLEEVAILLIENPAVSFTGCLLEQLVDRKIRVIFCDAKRSPMAELAPYHGSYDSTDKIRKQIKWQRSIKALIWRGIVQNKITKQACLLEEKGHLKEAAMLKAYVGQVEPLDESNREGHAAKVYFNALFGMEFSRGQDTPVNAALNYGYSILRSAFNREVAMGGYLTQLGIFHDNMFNHFNLSCDLMEPYRILVDRRVVTMPPDEFTKEHKYQLWNILNDTVVIDGKRQTVLNSIKIYSYSVLESLNTGEISLRFMQER
jgi:CRISPR-associated protein Cas1